MYMFGRIPTVAKAAARIKHIHWRFHDAVIAPSPYTVDWYTRTRLVAANRLNMVPNFLRPEGFEAPDDTMRGKIRLELGLPDTAFVIASVGGIQTRKNQSAMVPIVRALKDRGVDVHCVLIGGRDKSEAPKLLKEAEDQSVLPLFHLLGHRNDARRLLPGFDAIVSTSRDEQASIVLLEGLAAGLPLYFSNVGSAPSIIVDGENGLVFELDRTAPLIDALYHLAGSPIDAQRIGDNNRTLFAETYTPQAVLPKFEAVYQKLINAAADRKRA